MHECGKSCINSIEIGRAALRIALTSSRVEETKVKERPSLPALPVRPIRCT